jgi:hypothetical protein
MGLALKWTLAQKLPLVLNILRTLCAVKAISRDLIGRESDGVLDDFEQQLRSIRDLAPPNKVASWQIRPAWPLRTTGTSEYKHGAGGQRRVFARITCQWDVVPLGAASPKPQNATKRKLELAGIASTRVEVLPEDDETRVLGWWSMEIAQGAHNVNSTIRHPGCFFHVQLRADTDEPPFPHYLEVPRLPVFVSTPMLALEFVLGELFQNDWPKRVERGGHEQDQWRVIQWERFHRLLGWQNLELEKGKAGPASPWLTLKRAIPESDLFL